MRSPLSIGWSWSVTRFESIQPALQLDLEPRLVALARRPGGAALHVENAQGAARRPAGRDRLPVDARILPDRGAGQEAVLQAVAVDRAEIGIAQLRVLLPRPPVLLGEAGAHDTRIVGGEDDRHARRAVERERVRRALDAEELGVADQVDLDGDRAGGV